MNPARALLLSISILFPSCSGRLWAAGEHAKVKFFESKIRPVLVKHCYRCHSVESGESKGGLHLDSRSGWQVGGDSGPAIIPHKPDESLVIKAIGRGGEMSEMPPKSRLSAQVVDDFRKWIADGAVDPRADTSPAREAKAIDIEQGRRFWAFQPRRSFTKSRSIDEFARPRAPRAAAETLVRRLYLDLIGLPPSLDERTAFLRLYHERSLDEAVNTTANRLLDQVEFGQKWARHWLDVARYADSNGGDFNLTFPQAWRYRNYVIDAFNHDLPYDQFLREQIAGDLLPFDTAEQRNRQLIATGFLMIAPKMLTERNKAKMHLDITDEQLDTIGRAIMGLTLGCARCHDHKFDPITTADYYAMAGILHSTRTADGILLGNVNVSGWTETELLLDDETRKLVSAHQSAVEKMEAAIGQKKQAARAAPQDLRGIVVDDPAAQRSGPWRQSTLRPNHVGAHYLATDKGKGPYSIRWKARLPRPGKYELRVSFGGGRGLATRAPYVIRHATGEQKLVIDQTVQPTIRGLWHPIGRFTFESFAEIALTDENAGGAVIADAIQLVHVDDLEAEADTPLPSLNAEIHALEKELAELKKNAPEVPKAMAAGDHAGERLGDLRIRIRGEPANLGPWVPRGFPQVVRFEGSDVAAIPASQSGRVQLAQWLTHPNHPLTARVMVNRIWQQLLGQGIVATSDNFGTRGARPSHPELLDFLAEDFVANGWSVKSLIRQIVSSKTYQQAVQAASPDLPDNSRRLGRRARPAPAETIRDSILAIAGALDREPRESVVAQLGMYAIATSGARHASLGQTETLRQRSIYLPIVRGAVPPSLDLFGLPNPDLVTGNRAATTVPAQALFMMNSTFVREMARTASSRVDGTDLPSEEILKQLYQQILIRDADADEIEMGREYIARLLSDGKSRQEAIASFVQILFSSTEFRLIE